MPTYFDFEVSLREVEPRIWRRFLLRRTMSFKALHQAIQDACGWQHCHLFCFNSTHGKTESIAEADHGEERYAPPAGSVRLSRYFTGHPPQACHYVYDFGDNWEHDIVLRNVVDLRETFERRLLEGARAFPPEDCGGVSGYERMVAFKRTGVDPVGDEAVDLATWLGDWDPENFELEVLKQGFDR